MTKIKFDLNLKIKKYYGKKNFYIIILVTHIIVKVDIIDHINYEPNTNSTKGLKVAY